MVHCGCEAPGHGIALMLEKDGVVGVDHLTELDLDLHGVPILAPAF
jgi:hypothetical protein